MASGSILLDASGRKMLDDDGRVMLDTSGALAGICCPYIQATLCSGGSPADLWFKYNCSDATIVTTYGDHTALPFIFVKSGTYYRVTAANPISNTPGTMASGYTQVCACPNCLNCAGPICSASVTFSSVGLCSNYNACLNFTSGGNNYSRKYSIASAGGSIDGTYDLAISGCSLSLITTSPITLEVYNGFNCTGSPFVTFTTMSIVANFLGSPFNQLDLLVGQVVPSPYGGSDALFHDSVVTGSACAATRNYSNLLICTFPFGHPGTGGTAQVVVT